MDGGRWSDQAREQTERLRTRTRQLAVTSAVARRVATLDDAEAIVAAAVEELHESFEWSLCAALRLRDDGHVEHVAGCGSELDRRGGRRWSRPLDAGPIGQALRERRAVVSGDARSELVVPLWAGKRLWGALAVQESRADAFDDDDLRLLQTIANQLSPALRFAVRLQAAVSDAR